MRALLARLTRQSGYDEKGSLVAVVAFYQHKDERIRGTTYLYARAIDSQGRVLLLNPKPPYPDFEVMGGLPDDWTVEMLKSEPPT